MDKTSEGTWCRWWRAWRGTSILLLTTIVPVSSTVAGQILYPTVVAQSGRPSAERGALDQPAKYPAAHLEQMIVEKAEGNPFFLEELTRAVLEHADFETTVTVPDTIQGVLMARIDRLPEVETALTDRLGARADFRPGCWRQSGRRQARWNRSYWG